MNNHMRFFCWDNILGNDTEKLKLFLKDCFNIDWLESTEIRKVEENKVVHIHDAENWIKIIIDDKKEKANIKFSDGRIVDLYVENENGRLNVYYPKNIIDSIAIEKKSKLEGGGQDFIQSINRNIDIWGDPSHFVLELLQNADDAEANEVSYFVDSYGLIFSHNGKPFTKSNVWSICSIGRSDKKITSHIGYLGIGFKSIFKITEEPCIISEYFRFFFSKKGYDVDGYGWVLIPKWLEHFPEEVKSLIGGSNTVINIPFKDKLSNDVKTILKNMLESLIKPEFRPF